MKRLRTLAVVLPAYAVVVSWSLLAQGQAGNQAQAPASFSTDPMVASLKWRNIGNANLIGRVSAIDALENDFSHVVVGSASGGVFKSTNAGTSWTPIFDNYGVASIGDVAISALPSRSE
jgi:photosystem II stability/assembly factor-like uncharacterized protein